MLKCLKHDLPAGIAVFLVAVPLCLGIAIASGAPLLSGLIAGILGGILVGLLSKSPLSVSGPAAGLVAIVITTIGNLGFPTFLLSLIIAGAIQILFGVLKASKVAKFVPTSVIKGMLAAIGMTLIIKQLPVMLGINIKHFGRDIHNIAINALIIGIISLIVIVIWNTYFLKKIKVVPGSLIAVIIGVIIATLFKLYMPEFTLMATQLVSLPTNIHSISDFRANVAHPVFTGFNNSQIYITAITIALVASIETILSMQAIDKLDPEQRNTPLNRELIAQGIANMTSGLIGGLPVTSVIIRSSVNLNAGAKSKVSTIFHGILIVLAILFAANYINMIPMAVLAAVLVITGYQLTNPTKFIEKWKAGWGEFIPFVVTFIIVIAQDLLIGVLCGIVIYYVMLAIKHKWIPKKDILETNTD